VTGPLATRRPRPRRRITPNTNTSTTTMISTHNHVDMAASFGRRGSRDAVNCFLRPLVIRQAIQSPLIRSFKWRLRFQNRSGRMIVTDVVGLRWG
jgi:hypothetical protein